MKVPVLMITHFRLDYTKQAIETLLKCKDVLPYIIDNKSMDGTREYLISMEDHFTQMVFFERNMGIAGAMNEFLSDTEFYDVVGKCDNDTLLPPNFIEKMLPHMEHADLVQAKHKLIPASGVGTFDEWVSKMPNITPTLKQNHFIGGSGILFKRQLVNHIPESEDKLQGWRQWQREHPEVKKAFALDCEIELLDEHGYEDYPEYYKMTGRC